LSATASTSHVAGHTHRTTLDFLSNPLSPQLLPYGFRGRVGNSTSRVALGRLFGFNLPLATYPRFRVRFPSSRPSGREPGAASGTGAANGRLRRKTYLGQRETSIFLPNRHWVRHEGREGGRLWKGTRLDYTRLFFTTPLGEALRGAGERKTTRENGNAQPPAYYHHGSVCNRRCI
jgi:hypothetical protein